MFNNIKRASRIRTFNKVITEAKSLPPMTRLYGDLIYKNEVILLVGNTNTGKSILAVNIAIDIANGANENVPFANEDVSKNVVLYIDLELSDRQFQKRFSQENYPDNLFRVDISPECTACEFNFDEIINCIKETKANVLIFDNLSAFLMTSGVDADIAISFMAKLKELQRAMGITAVVLAHTPKMRFQVPLNVDHVGGSKMLVNFADSVFFISNSILGKDIRYLKHVKGRNAELPSQVYTMQLHEVDNRLSLQYKEMSDEQDHLGDHPDTLNKREKAKSLRAEGFTMERIAEELGVNKSTISRWL